MVAGGDAEPRVAVDDARRFFEAIDTSARSAADQAGADRGAAHGADDRLGAVDDVVDDVAASFQVASARL